MDGMRVVGHGKLLYDGTGGRTSDREVPFEGIAGCAVSGYGKESVQGYYRLEDFRVALKPLTDNMK